MIGLRSKVVNLIRNKGKLFGQVPDFNFFMVLLVFLVKQFSISFQFSNCNILET